MAKLKPNQLYLAGHLLTERPILFQTEMVQANLEDRKTQTRRKLKVRGCKPFYPDTNWDLNEIKRWTKDYHPYGKPGDLLWVRETWGKWGEDYYYRASTVPGTEVCKWKPSIHMPKAASRLWLMVEDIRVERVQDITETDAIAEGIKLSYVSNGVFVWIRYDGYAKTTTYPVVSFWSLWASINGEASWNSNPWVWVIQYRILSKTGRPSDDTVLENYLQITRKEATNG